MGIALLTLSGLFQGFSALQRKAATLSLTGTMPARVHPAHAQRMARPLARPSTHRPASLATPAPRPAALRVVRVCDAHNPSGEMGRLVISGRMADVCAELDRLVAREAAQQGSLTRH